MKGKTLFILVVAICLTSSLAFGDTVTGNLGSWQSFTTGDLNEDHTPYFDQPSWDGSHKNVGYFLTKTGAYSSGTDYLGTNPQFWGQGSPDWGKADTGFHWTNASPAGVVTLLIEVAGYANTNKFGWFEWDSGTPHEIFDGSASAPSTVMVVPIGEDYGFYLQRADGVTFYTDVNGNKWTNPDSKINFAVFRGDKYGPNVFFLGVEDLTEAELGWCGEGGIGDFNDMVVKVKPVPIPPSALLLGSGLLGLGLLGWRRGKST